MTQRPRMKYRGRALKLKGLGQQTRIERLKQEIRNLRMALMVMGGDLTQLERKGLLDRETALVTLFRFPGFPGIEECVAGKRFPWVENVGGVPHICVEFWRGPDA